MEKVKKEKSIKKDFIYVVTVTILIVVVLSGITIFGCYRIKKYILPDSQEIWLHTQTVMEDGTVSEAKQRFTLVAKQKGCEVEYHSTIASCEVKMDEQIFYRVTENVFSNALRYAESKIVFQYALADNFLSITVTDDGKGFSKTMLQKQNTYFYSEDTTGKHMGLGLVTGRVLCQKHGGCITISNTEQGACVAIRLLVKMCV